MAHIDNCWRCQDGARCADARREAAIEAFDRIIAYVYDTIEDAGLEWIELKPWWWDEDLATVRASLKVPTPDDQRVQQ